MEDQNWEKKILASTPDIAMAVDEDGKILFISKTVAGFSADQVVGTSVDNYVPPGYHDAYKAALKEVFEKRQTTEFVVSGVGANGTTAWYLTRIAPIVTDDVVEGASMISTDITKRMLVDDDLKAAKKEVDRLNELLKQKDQG